MESIFENTTTLTRQNLTEMARATVPRWSLLVGIIPAVLAVHSTNGKWDLIAELATQTLLELDEVIYRIRSIEGVVTSETNLLLSTRKAGRK